PRLAANDLLDDREPARRALHGTRGEASVLDHVAVHTHRRGDIHEREIPNVAVGDFLEIEPRSGPARRNADRRQQLAGLEYRHPRDVDARADEELLGGHLALSVRARDDHPRVEHDHRRRRIRRAHGDAAVRAPETVLAVLPFGRIRVAGISAGAITVHAVAVVPAARVLTEIPADRSGIADLRARDLRRGLGQHAEARTNHVAALDLGQRRQRADLDAAVRRLADPLQGLDSGQVDDVARPLHAILEPVEAVVAAGQRPAVLAETAEQIERRLQRVRLVELEARHHVSGAHRSLRFSTAPLPFSSMSGPGPMLSLYLDPFSPAQAVFTCS